MNHFPIYEPSAERVAEIAAAHAEENNPLNVHYDASREVRAKGAGFYQFSADEETRRAQMEELKSARGETGKIRNELGAMDVRPGEVEGMRNTEESGSKSRAMEKRKRDLEERRRLLDAKRRKVSENDSEDTSKPALTSAETPPISASHTPTALPDPLAILEAKSKHIVKEIGKTQITSDADTFLAQLEKEFIGAKGKQHR